MREADGVQTSVIKDLMQRRSFFPTVHAPVLAGMAVAMVLGISAGSVRAQSQTSVPTTIPPQSQTDISSDGQTRTTTSTATDSTGKQVQSVTTSRTLGRGKKKSKEDKVVQSKDTKKSLRKGQKTDALAGIDAKLPDKQLYDKALVAMKKGHYDVARLDLQTMLNTYPNSEYQMRAKLAVADSWYKEGGTAALTQAESEYADFRVFFPNVPEAAEAQMRIGDIYFRQMDKPDRDYAKALHSEEEYRRMLTDYPDSTLVPQAKQRLREVQEVLATRENDIASYYATHENWAAVIARYQTVIDSYPLFSHVDDTLIGLGDAYEAEARFFRASKLPESGKAKLEKLYDDQAAEAYRKVVLEHSAAPHVEDARDRLAAMNLPIPEPTREQVAASEAMENSRSTYSIAARAKLLVMHTPDTVTTARIGEPTLVDPKPTLAPTLVRRAASDFNTAFNNATPAAPAPATDAAITPAAAEPAASAPAKPAAPLAFEDLPSTDGAAPASGSTFTASPAAATPSSGNSLGVEILTPSARVGGGAPDTSGGLKPVGPPDAAPLPTPEKAGEAPDRLNEITAPTTPAQAPRADGKRTKPEFDKSDESSSKHKKKKGLKKVNPF